MDVQSVLLPSLELFANANHILPRYVSPCPDVKAWETDALRCRWPQETVRIFASQSNVEVPQETTGRGNVSHCTGRNMVGSNQVGPSVMHSPHSSDRELSNRGPAPPTTALGQRARASPSIRPPADTFGEGYLRQQGFSDSVIERICNSRALSTRKHYRSQWELFVSWAVAKHLDPMNALLPLLTEFID